MAAAAAKCWIRMGNSLLCARFRWRAVGSLGLFELGRAGQYSHEAKRKRDADFKTQYIKPVFLEEQSRRGGTGGMAGRVRICGCAGDSPDDSADQHVACDIDGDKP